MTPANSARPDRRPPYMHAADEIRREIKKGRFKPGEQLPSYRELQERFRIANMTARSALQVLRDEGLIYTIQGRGSFVADIPDQAGEFSIEYTPPAWYLASAASGRSDAEVSPEEKPAEAREAEEQPGGTLSAKVVLEELSRLAEQMSQMQAEYQEMKAELEELKRHHRGTDS